LGSSLLHPWLKRAMAAAMVGPAVVGPAAAVVGFMAVAFREVVGTFTPRRAAEAAGTEVEATGTEAGVAGMEAATAEAAW
jgi:hypothetical protein